MWWVIKALFGAELPIWEEIAHGVVLLHNGEGVVIHPGTRFEGDALVFHRVTLGNSWGSHEGTPSIGRDVIIGVGASVLGNVRIGEGSMVAAGAVVTRDVPPGSLAIGNPAQVKPLAPNHVRDLLEPRSQ